MSPGPQDSDRLPDEEPFDEAAEELREDERALGLLDDDDELPDEGEDA